MKVGVELVSQRRTSPSSLQDGRALRGQLLLTLLAHSPKSSPSVSTDSWKVEASKSREAIRILSGNSSAPYPSTTDKYDTRDES
jgi:hypothetical protein